VVREVGPAKVVKRDQVPSRADEEGCIFHDAKSCWFKEGVKREAAEDTSSKRVEKTFD